MVNKKLEDAELKQMMIFFFLRKQGEKKEYKDWQNKLKMGGNIHEVDVQINIFQES
jgi:hypothetical protein